MEGRKPRHESTFQEESTGDLTILLLGETGVGKSTWINGLANFLRFETLEVAEAHPAIVCAIPTSFLMTDNEYRRQQISVGDQDENENTEIGQSATQHPYSYLFKVGNRTLRLIDTPGIGDVRGMEQDRKNMKKILKHISRLEHLNLICILLKPNNSRLNFALSTCLTMLLTHLHRDASRNIVFCFTNTRSTFYRPGDTFPTLQQLLGQFPPDVQIRLNPSTTYCVDNESIRFLYAVKNGVKFEGDERESCSRSWNNSVAEIKRLLQHASQQIPHDVHRTVSLNNAREAILVLRRPLAEICRNIQDNVARAEEVRSKITQGKSEQMTKEFLTLQHVGVQFKALPNPRTVCTAKTCAKKECHRYCHGGKSKGKYIFGKKGHPTLRKCSAFTHAGGICKSCDCSWRIHMKIDKIACEVSRSLVVPEGEDALNFLNERLAELEMAEVQVIKACAKFSHFLNQNELTDHRDPMISHIMALISQEKEKLVDGAGDERIYSGLVKMLEKYKAMLSALEGEPPIQTSDLDEIIHALYKVKDFGQDIKQMVEISKITAKDNYLEKDLRDTKDLHGQSQFFFDFVGKEKEIETEREIFL